MIVTWVGGPYDGSDMEIPDDSGAVVMAFPTLPNPKDVFDQDAVEIREVAMHVVSKDGKHGWLHWHE